MTQQYWVGEFFVDLSRNQITVKEEVKTLAPKALSVLTLLAQHQARYSVRTLCWIKPGKIPLSRQIPCSAVLLS